MHANRAAAEAAKQQSVNLKDFYGKWNDEETEEKILMNRRMARKEVRAVTLRFSPIRPHRLTAWSEMIRTSLHDEFTSSCVSLGCVTPQEYEGMILACARGNQQIAALFGDRIVDDGVPLAYMENISDDAPQVNRLIPPYPPATLLIWAGICSVT